MRRVVSIATLGLAASAAHSQATTSTNCVGAGWSVQCNSTTYDSGQQQQQMNEAFRNLGAAIAARRERKRAEHAAEEARVQEEAIRTAVQSALDSDNAPASPPPTDEKPVLLVCTVNNAPASIALYEKHNRADVTSAGVTRTRMATFTPEAVTWTSPLLRSTLSRMDGSYIAYGNIPAVAGQSINGSCKVANDRAF